jgi:hypothetical protein
VSDSGQSNLDSFELEAERLYDIALRYYYGLTEDMRSETVNPTTAIANALRDAYTAGLDAYHKSNPTKFPKCERTAQWTSEDYACE